MTTFQHGAPTRPRRMRLQFALPALLALAACGGGGVDVIASSTPAASGSGDPATGATAPRPPATSAASVDSYVRFLQSMPADETSDPLDTQGYVAPVSETAEPAEI